MGLRAKLANSTRPGGATKGGAILSRLLAAEGVDTVFGIIDGTYFGMYASFEAHGIRLITPRHESSAVHMAGSYARLSGKLGVCMASNGPGVANALPGIAVEQAEGNRVLVITSSRRQGIIYPDRGGTFQYFPQVPVIAAMSKWSRAVPSLERLPELCRKALRACFTGRPGVVHLDVPESIMNADVELSEDWFPSPAQYRPTEALQPSSAQLAAAVRLLSLAERPLIHAGSGVIHAQAFAALARVAERLHAPITTSWAARSVVDERSPLSLPMPYVDALKKARNEADLVLILGSRLGETGLRGKAPYWASPAQQQVIQVDIDPDCLGNIRPTAVAIEADVGAFLDQLSRSLPPSVPDGRKKWVASLTAARTSRRKKLDQHLKNDSLPMHWAHVPTTCREVFADEDILIIDGGNTAIWANFFFALHSPNTAVSTPKMGMLGAGLPQALGAQLARPDKRVCCIIGDGAMGFQPQELETAVRNELPVVYLVLCDRAWGMVRINQQFALKPLKTLVRKTLSPEETINTDLGEIQWDELARSMGAHGERVADPAGLKGAIERALASGLPAVIHVDVDPVAHMWAPNLKTFKEMHAEPAG